MRDRELDGLLNDYFEKEDFAKINDLLIKFFKIYFSNKIKEKNEDYKYTTLNDLLEFSKKYIDKYEQKKLLRFYEIQSQDDEKQVAFELKELFDFVKEV